MRTIVLTEPGGPRQLTVAERPVPTPGPGQALLRTEAAAVSYYETLMRSGAVPMPIPLPMVFGSEAAGVVTEVGAGVDNALIGKRMVGMTGVGAYAEYVAAPASMLTTVPDGVSATDAVAVTMSAATALLLLSTARLADTDKVLIEGASGVVGGYLVQLARLQGVTTVIATAGGPAKRTPAIEAGADIVIDHTNPDWPDQVRAALNGSTLDVVFESIGGDSARALLDTLAPGSGRMVFYGTLSGQPPTITPTDLLHRGVSLIGAGGLSAVAARLPAAQAEVLNLTATGALRPLVDSVLPLAAAAKAHQRIEDRQAIGKIVLTP
ncbi:MAG: zinc-binding dehydrogenase [Kibdelosporangium sp.]